MQGSLGYPLCVARLFEVNAFQVRLFQKANAIASMRDTECRIIYAVSRRVPL